jgi:hypothetical protein
MKIIITESQYQNLLESDKSFEKTKRLVTNMWADGMDIEDIKTYTSFSTEQVLILLKDSDMEIDCKMAPYFVNKLFNLGLVKKIHTFNNDTVELRFGNVDIAGTLEFEYSDKNYILIGLATPYWNGCFTPVDGSYFENKIDGSYIDTYDNTNQKFDCPEYFYSINELIEWLNNEYPKKVMSKIQNLLEYYIKY